MVKKGKNCEILRSYNYSTLFHFGLSTLNIPLFLLFCVWFTCIFFNLDNNVFKKNILKKVKERKIRGSWKKFYVVPERFQARTRVKYRRPFTIKVFFIYYYFHVTMLSWAKLFNVKECIYVSAVVPGLIPIQGKELFYCFALLCKVWYWILALKTQWLESHIFIICEWC